MIKERDQGSHTAVGGEEPFLCFDVDCDSRLEVDGEMIFENGDLRDQALDKRLVKDRDGGGLLPDEILKVSDQTHLFILDNAVDLSLLSHVPQPEDLVCDCIVVVLLVGFLQEFLPVTKRNCRML